MGLPEPTTPPKPLWQRIAWMALIWVASVAALGVVAMLIRLLMTTAGMRS
jgi:hypothetical protein